MCLLINYIQDLTTIPLQSMKTNSIIIHEAKTPETYNIHIICPDCMIPQLSFVDVWTKKGLTRPYNYFRI